MNCCYTDLELNRCQFSEKNTYKCDGKQWCIYHLPMMDQKGVKTKKGHYTDKDIAQFNETIIRLIDGAKKINVALRLNGVTFPGVIDFSNKEFPEIFFNDALFIESADFTGAIFSDDAIFSHVYFNGKTWFDAANFNVALFFGTTFNDDARFKEAIFNDAIIFKNATFHGNAFFDGSDHSDQFKGDVNFSGVHFNHHVSFINRIFKQSTTFENAVFMKAPAFHNSELHQDTEFSGAQFKDRSAESGRAYRTLKLEMEKRGAIREQSRFFVLEEEAMRKRRDTPSSKAGQSGSGEGTLSRG